MREDLAVFFFEAVALLARNELSLWDLLPDKCTIYKEICKMMKMNEHDALSKSESPGSKFTAFFLLVLVLLLFFVFSAFSRTSKRAKTLAHQQMRHSCEKCYCFSEVRARFQIKIHLNIRVR